MKQIRPKAIVTAAIVLFVVWQFGNLAWMNIRPDDPLPMAFEAYEPAAFAQALEDGGPVLVQIYASWCPTCKAQQQAFALLAAEGGVPDARGFRVDYDENPEFLARHNAAGTGLLLAFRDGREIARRGGLVDKQALGAFLKGQGML